MKVITVSRVCLFAMLHFVVSCSGTQPPAVQSADTVEPSDEPCKGAAERGMVCASLSKDDIKNTMESAAPALDQCYTTELERDPDSRGSMVFKVIVNSDGKVRMAAIHTTGISSEDMKSCSLAVVNDLVFPKPAGNGGIVVFTYSYEFGNAA